MLFNKLDKLDTKSSWINSHLILPHHEGFVYTIEQISTGLKYIGRKYLYTKRMDTSKGYRVTKPADYESYQSSSDIVQLWDSKDVIKTIIALCNTRGETNYTEVKLLYEHNVLIDPVYMNKAIGKYRRGYVVEMLV